MIKDKVLSKRAISVVIISTIFLVTILFANFILNNKDARVHHHLEAKEKEKPSHEMINQDNTIKSNFSTHLPLVIMDTNGEEPKADSAWDSEKGYFAPLDHDPYVSGSISVIDNENEVNRLADNPVVESDIKVRLRGNSSLSFDKKQYLVKFTDSDGSKNKQDVLGMGLDHEWILNISYIDKSLIRNYMGLNIAGQIMPNIPENRYCELVVKDGEEYKYQGIYLIMESIKQGEDRVSISEYDNKFKTSSYLLRRDRFNETGIIIDNYGRQNELTTGYLEIKYPSKKDITKKTIDYITEDINKFEKTIFSNDPKEFYKYKEYIDEDSFIDYFIINEFFTNYDAGYHSTYSYKEIGEKIKMGPVWDFDMGIDNIRKIPLKIDSTAMHDTPWFRQLLRDSRFTTKLIDRYHKLRKNVLSEENIIKYIDDTVDYLGPAQDRDWKRWEQGYTSKYLIDVEDENGNIIDRNTNTYKSEISKIKNILIKHGTWLDENIDSLYQFSEFEESSIDLEKNKNILVSSILSATFIIIFIVSIVLVQRD